MSIGQFKPFYIYWGEKNSSKCLMNHTAFVGSSCFTLCEVKNGKEQYVCNLCPSMDMSQSEFFVQGNLNANKIKDYVLYINKN